ncbi:hypothetical protein C8J56DRAFT_1038093 [Mycena floridula]|nr:hypothetical protein C8J56DRAFT_1038093 [Mycena floridula]
MAKPGASAASLKASTCRHASKAHSKWTTRNLVAMDGGIPGPRFSVQTLSADRQRVAQDIAFTLPPSPVKKRRIEESKQVVEQHFDNDQLDIEEALSFAGVYGQWNEEREVHVDKDIKSKRYISSDEPLKAWTPFRDEHLEIMVSLEASEWMEKPCMHCPDGIAGTALYHCDDCFEMVPVCQVCCVYEHCQMPLHVIKKWNGSFFKTVSLQALGLHMQLGHVGNSPCPSRKENPVEFTVIDMNGIHSVSVDYCHCHSGATTGAEYKEILLNEWFPATHIERRTAATFRCIQQFHILTLTGKVTPFDYYTGLQRLTDNTGCKKLLDRYREFLHIGHEFRHLRACKRELGIQCPACPRPGVNLPADWMNAEPKRKFIYTLFLAMDACFCLKRKIVSNNVKDPGLGMGFAYFVEDKVYQAYCKTLGDQTEDFQQSTTQIPGFQGVTQVTGVGLGLCARHELIAVNGIDDMQKGEKYGNMTYIFTSLLCHVCLLLAVMLSYDINCQFYKNFAKQVQDLPPLVRLDLILKLFRFAILKLHIMGHEVACQREFNLNYMVGIGRTDGEGVERPWASIGPVATSTREMGPGHRHDTLDDHWRDWNWRKIVASGKLLKRRHEEAMEELAVQEEAFGKFSYNQLAELPEWRARVEEWELDSSKPNPYKQEGSTIMLQEVRLRLAQDEAVLASAGLPGVHDISPAEFMILALDLEENQRCLKQEVMKHQANRSRTTKQSADLIEKRNKVTRQISRFCPIQTMYMAATVQILTELGKAVGRDGMPIAAPAAEDVPVLFPSDLTAEQRSRGIWPGLEEIEMQLRDAQCRDALDQLRNQLIIKARLLTYKSIHAQHQGATTRSQGLLEQNEAKIAMSAIWYQQSWEAKQNLVSGVVEEVGWRKLDVSDIQCMTDLTETAKERKKRERRKGKRKWDVPTNVEDAADRAGLVSGVSEGRRKLSWIWTEAELSGLIDAASLKDGLRVEWSKCWARVRRWREENSLLSEEMRRVLVSLEWKAKWWEEHQVVPGFSGQRAAGATALAARQAANFRAIADRFCTLWRGWNIEGQAGDSALPLQLLDVSEDVDIPLELEREEEEEDQRVEEEGLDLGLDR